MSERSETQNQLERENGELRSRIDVLEHEARLDKEETFRALADNANDGIFLTIGAGIQAYANKRAAEITGYSVAELLGTSVRDLAHPDELGKIMERYAKRLAGEQVLSQYETILISKEKRSVPVEVTAARTVWQGQPADLAIVRDISERRQAEQRLRESEQLLHTQFSNSPDLIIIIDRHMKIVTLNRVMAGPDSIEQLIGRDAVDILPTNRDMVRHRITECFVSGEKQEFEHEIGDGIWVHARLVPLPSAAKPHAGVIERIMIISTDITGRKRAEEERLRLQAQLFQAQKMESVGSLAGGVAHDFNNLLAAILAGLSLMELDGGDGPGWQEQLSDMKALVQRGADLTKQLLGFARLGRYDAKPLDLNDVVTKISKLFGRTRKDIVVRIACAFGILPALADRTQIEQVLLNLLVNAGQSMPDGGDVLLRTENVELTVATDLMDGALPGRYVKLSVTDTGVGMDAKTRERIFDPFFTTKEIGCGTGLGLASVYGIVKNHGGFVTVESEPGKGSTFNVFLPATDQRIVGEQGQAAGAATAAHHKGDTILMVDDEEQIVRSVSRLLVALGYTVLTARNGSEAVEIFRRNHDRVALVILDMIMPGLSGGQTFEALRAVAPSVKVLLSSGYSIEGQATTIMNRGCNGFIQKPFGLAELSAKIKEIL
jgi:two-component system cell cycle sensor histidine kinase/response regulator CckA